MTMAFCHEISSDSYEVDWHLENFDFCWHRTGERLESPTFKIDFTKEIKPSFGHLISANPTFTTYWSIWLYPRGEDDGEYISCYLFREEDGPEVVEVDFEFHLSFGEKFLKSNYFSKIYSFKCFQKEGVRCFILRKEVLSEITKGKDILTLTLNCNILNHTIGNRSHTIFTSIKMAHISGTEILDSEADLDSKTNKDIEIRPILEDESLININLSYVEESLVIKIQPGSCQKIKYATLKINAIDNYVKGSQIEHVRHWLGKIKTDVWRYHVPCTKELFGNVGVDTISGKAFLLHYDFAFSIGEVLQKNGFEGFHSYMKTLDVSFQSDMNSDLTNVDSAQTAVHALGEVYQSESYVDMNLIVGTKIFPTNRAILCSRSALFKSMVKKDATELFFNIFPGDDIEEFLYFLYTDIVEYQSFDDVPVVYNVASYLGVELLQTKSRNFLLDNLDYWNVHLVLNMARIHQDLPMKTIAENYILSHYDLILNSVNWKNVYRDYHHLPKQIFLMKYKKERQNSLVWS